MTRKYLTVTTLTPWSRILLQDQVAPRVFFQTFSELSVYPKFTSVFTDLSGFKSFGDLADTVAEHLFNREDGCWLQSRTVLYLPF